MRPDQGYFRARRPFLAAGSVQAVSEARQTVLDQTLRAVSDIDSPTELKREMMEPALKHSY